MTRVRKLLGLGAFVATVALVSAYSQGQTGSKKGTNPADTSPQSSAAGAYQKVEADSAADASRFSEAGVLTYQPVKGDLVFALQVKHNLPEQRRPREILVMISSTATMVGPGWTAARQIAEGIVETAGADDQVSLWVVNDTKTTGPLTTNKGFLDAGKDTAEGKTLPTPSSASARRNIPPASPT